MKTRAILSFSTFSRYTTDMASQPRMRMTYEEYAEGEKTTLYRNEYFRGEVFPMCSGTGDHAQIGANVMSALHQELRRRGCRLLAGNMRFHIAAVGLHTYCDGIVVRGECEFFRDDHYVLANPTLLIEVVSPDSEAFDRGRKAEFYRIIPSLAHYLLIAEDRLSVELFTRLDDKTWQLNTGTHITDALYFSAFETSLSVAEIYRGIDLPPARLHK